MPSEDHEREPASRHDPGAHRPLIELIDLHKSFGSQRVLEGVNLNFRQGQTTVVLGQSGSGKSVILKHIAGLLRPDSGEIRYDSLRIDHLPERDLTPMRKEMGFLFQLSALFDSMTIAENLEFPLIEHSRLSPEERRERIKDVLAVVDLAGVELKHPAQLSGGQQRRAALARAIIQRPRLMLYDEPTTGLDPIRAAGISDLIMKLKNETGMTGIVVTHDLACMRKVADRVVMLHDGRIIADGTPDELASSEDPHVQHFITGTAEAELDRFRNESLLGPPPSAHRGARA
ncbi:MAG: ABC transporter ATP-binding protein [Phycisphaerae bacterium]|nr:ABC transporter ATP-binding protein [Phycisphaerae bacterium]